MQATARGVGHRRFGQSRMSEVGERIEAVCFAPLDIDVEHPSAGYSPGRHADQGIRPKPPPRGNDRRVDAGVMKSPRRVRMFAARTAGDAGEHRYFIANSIFERRLLEPRHGAPPRSRSIAANAAA